MILVRVEVHSDRFGLKKLGEIRIQNVSKGLPPVSRYLYNVDGESPRGLPDARGEVEHRRSRGALGLLFRVLCDLVAHGEIEPWIGEMTPELAAAAFRMIDGEKR